MKDNTSLLKENQVLILTEFIKKFLPQRGNKRKNPGNELEKIANTIDRIFKKQFGFSVSYDDIIDAFENLNYSIFTKMGEWNSEKKIIKPSNDGGTKMIKRGSLSIKTYIQNNAAFIYIDIDAFRIRDLYRTTITLSPDTNMDKLIEQKRLIEEISSFKKSYVDK